MEIKRSETHALMGPNGAGKSTLGLAIMGHPGYEVTAGRIELGGEDIRQLKPDQRARKGLFMAFQRPLAIPGVKMADFLPVAKVSEIPDLGKLVVECDQRLVVVFHLEGNFYCLDDVCTHDGGTLGDGSLERCQIVCPRHGAQFDIRTGEPLSMPATKAIGSHLVRVEGEDILVKLNS
jgi:nitrite reductase/ring-hydroxylating ferredoxin subunit